MNQDRRKFIKIFSLSTAGLTAGSILGSCTRMGINPITHVVIDEQDCIGCGDCLEYCFYDAIKLPVRSLYKIDQETCLECGKCVDPCEFDAFKISMSEYHIFEEKCIGCGDCIDKCVDEGNCITYEREEYEVKSRCKPDRCDEECFKACEYDAITMVGGKAFIDTEKCVKCGLCVRDKSGKLACPREAIHAAKVEIDNENCNQCGKCFDVCEFQSVNKVKPENYELPHIDLEKCTSCGDCLIDNFCDEHLAIKREIELANIVSNECRDCLNCIDSCKVDAIINNT